MPESAIGPRLLSAGPDAGGGSGLARAEALLASLRKPAETGVWVPPDHPRLAPAPAFARFYP